MEKKYTNRYNSFCSSLDSLKRVEGRDITDEFVLSGTIRKFILTFDISWKVMKDIIVNYHKITSFTTGSPRETLRTAAIVGLIDDQWMDMLEDRNNLTHDYDSSLAEKCIHRIIQVYIPLFEEFRTKASGYLDLMN